MTRQDKTRLFLLSLAVVAFGLFSASQAAAQSRSAGAWVSGFGQGWQEINTRSASGEFTISCDIANSADHGGTHIRVAIDGRSPPPNSNLIFEVDGHAIIMPTDGSGRIAPGDCADCAQSFNELWQLLRRGRQLQVYSAQGGNARFSLRGTSRVMPQQPCPTKLAAGETAPDTSPGTPARAVPADCIALNPRGQTEVVGMARPGGGVCYALETSRGQIARLEIVDGRNIAITVPGIADARERLEFDTEDGPYEIRIIQVERADRASRYRLRVAMREGSLDNGPGQSSLEDDTGRSSLADEFARRAQDGPAAAPGAEGAQTDGRGSAQVTLPILGKAFALTLGYGPDEPPLRNPQEAVRHFPADLRAAEGETPPDDEILGVVEERAWAAQLQFTGIFEALLKEEMKGQPQGRANAVEEDLLAVFEEGSGARHSADGQRLFDERLALSLVVRGLRRALGYPEQPEDSHFTVPELPAELREAYTRQGYDPAEAYRAYRRLRAAYRVADFGLLDRAVAYPLIVIDEGPGMTVANLQELLGADILVMNRALREIALKQDFADLFVRDQGAMFGDGALWMTPACASGECARRLALRTINLAGLKPLEPISLPEPAAPPPAAPAIATQAVPETAATSGEEAEDAEPDAADDGKWQEARERLRADILARARDFCRSVHDAEGSLRPGAITDEEKPGGGAPDLVVSYRGIECAGIEDAPLKLGGFCGLTMDGMKCHVEVYSFKNGDYVEARSYLE